MIHGDRLSAEPRLENRLKWLMSFRLAVALVGLSVVLVFESGFPPGPYVVLTSACVLNLAYLVAARLRANTRAHAVVQLVVDLLLSTELIYLVGPQHPFVVLFFACVLSGAVAFGQRAAFWCAFMSAILLAAVAALYHYSSEAAVSLPFVAPKVVEATVTRLSFMASYVGFFAAGFLGVAFLAGKLSEEVRQVRILNDEILQNMSGGVVAIDRLGQIAYVNAQAQRMLGMQLNGTGVEYARTMPREVAALFQRALSGGQRVEEEIVVDGTPVEIAISHLADGRSGGLRGVVAIVNDLTLRSEVEKMTQQAGRFRALLEMSAGIAHEIRNPLASIRGAAQELQGARFPDPDDRKLLDVVMRESDRLDKIITDFLEYASDRPMQASLCNLADVLAEVVVLLQARDSEHRMRIELQVPRTIVCRGAPDKLKQVFLNLGVNALEAVGAKGALVIRCLSATAPEGAPRDGVLVEFEDNGPGIPKEDIPRVFDPFFTTKAKGTGMGLAIARKIVHEHGGSIVALSTPGKGATLRVWLPGD